MRRLDTSELAFYAATRRTLTNCVIAAHLDRAPGLDALRVALDRVQARHPLLRVRVEHGEVPRFCDDDVPALALTVVPRGGPETWLERVNVELNAPFELHRGPLCRFTLVRGAAASELLVSFSHIIGDAMAGATLVRDVVAALARPLAPLPVRPALTEQLSALGLPLPGLGLLGKLVDVAADSLASAAYHFTGADGPPRPPAGVVHHAASVTLDAACSRRILADCRAADTTVHGLLCATLLTQIARQRGAGRVGLVTPINIRPLLGADVEHDLGIHAYAPALHVKLGPDEPRWPLARQLTGQVRWLRKLFAPRMSGLAMRALRPWVGGPAGASLSALLRRTLTAQVVASNVGKLTPFTPGDAIEVTGLSMFAIVPDVDLVMVSQSYGDRLTLNFIHTTPAARPGLAEAVRDGMLAALRG